MRNAADLHQHIYIPFHIEMSPSKFGFTGEVNGWCSENLSSYLSAPAWFSSWDNETGTQCVPCPALLKGGRHWQGKLPFHPLHLLKHISNLSKRQEVLKQRKWRQVWGAGLPCCPWQFVSRMMACTEPPTVPCLHAPTPAWVKNLQDTFCLPPASLTAKALFPDLGKMIRIHDLKIYLHLCS